MIDVFWRAWIALDGYTIPAYAYPATIKLNGGSFSAEMAHCAEWGPLSRGKKPRKSNIKVSGFFKAVCGQGGGTLSPSSPGFSIDEEDLGVVSFTAFTQEGQTTNPVQVLTKGSLNGMSRAILVHAGGVFDSTPDLTSSSLTCVVSYPHVVEASEEDAELATLYIVGKQDSAPVISVFNASNIRVNGKHLSLTVEEVKTINIQAA